MRTKQIVLRVFAVLVVLSNGAADARGVESFEERERLLRDREPVRTSLVGETLVNEPVTVQGEGRATIIRSSRSINTRTLVRPGQATPLKVLCPEYGGAIIVSDLTTVNFGRVYGFSIRGDEDAAASTVVYECNSYRDNELSIDGQTSINEGSLISE